MFSIEFDPKHLLSLTNKASESVLLLPNENASSSTGYDFFSDEAIDPSSNPTLAAPHFHDLALFSNVSFTISTSYEGEQLRTIGSRIILASLIFLSLLLFCCFLKPIWRSWLIHSSVDPTSSLFDLPLPPGDFGFPIIGETLNWITEGSDFNATRRRKFGNVFKTNVLGIPMIRVTGHEYVKQILLGEHDKVEAVWPTSVRSILGKNGMINSSGALHRLKRKIACKAFTSSALNNYIPQMQREIKRKMKDLASGGEPRVYDEMIHLTYDLAASALLGLDPDTSSSIRLMENFHTLITNLFCVPINLPGTSFNKALQARVTILDLLDDHIRDRKTAILKELAEDEDKTCEVKSVLDAIIREMLLENIKSTTSSRVEATEIDDLTLKEVAMELMFAGYFTSGSALTSCALELARNPAVVRKMEEEMHEYGLLSEDGEATPKVDLHLIHRLTYMDNVLKETLRLRPSVLGGYRRAKKTFQLGNYRIPKGWTVVYNIRDTHEFEFESKKNFEPERFETKLEGDEKYRFIPFGGGARMCIGREYARLIIKLTLVELIRSFDRWELVNPGLPKMKVIPVLHPADGLPCRFYPRDQIGVATR